MPASLPIDTLRLLRDAAVTASIAGTANDSTRRDLLDGIPTQVTSRLKTDYAKPMDQIFSDLKGLNGFDNMPDGSVPLLTWLDNAIDKVYGTEHEKAFAAAKEQLAAGNLSAPRPVATAPKDGGQERVVHVDDMLDFAFLRAGERAGAAVAKIVVTQHQGGAVVLNRQGKPAVGSGTCWLLTPTVAVTNHHVVNAREVDGVMAEAADLERQSLTARVQFDYDDANATVEEVGVAALLAADATLDYALLRLTQNPQRAPLRISPTSMTVAPGESVAVNILQHPNGQPKRVAVRNNLVNQSGPDTLSYFTDTLRGSSGSPVCDDAWRVVALHRGWQPVVNVRFQGRDTAYANYGTHVLRLLRDARGRLPAGVWDEVREAQRPALDAL